MNERELKRLRRNTQRIAWDVEKYGRKRFDYIEVQATVNATDETTMFRARVGIGNALYTIVSENSALNFVHDVFALARQ